MKEKICNNLKILRAQKPLVLCLTNTVVTDFNANALLALGALPVMSESREDVVEMVRGASALYLNIGTLTKDLVDIMISGGQVANECGVPVILDPVGVGATAFRLNEALRILENVKVDVLKGNPGEIEALLGVKSEMKGVESIKTSSTPKDLCQEAGKKFNLVCAITGKKDFVSDGKLVFELNNGVEMLNKVVGTGCTVGAFCGAFCGVDKDFVTASLSALSLMSVAGELAEPISGSNPATFKMELINSFYNIDENILLNRVNIKMSPLKQGF